jgi:hypothetical protein
MPTTEAFDKLLKSMKKEYLGEKVPEKYKKQYGTMYNKKDVLSFAIATAKSKGIPIDKKEKKINRWYE